MQNDAPLVPFETKCSTNDSWFRQCYLADVRIRSYVADDLRRLLPLYRLCTKGLDREFMGTASDWYPKLA